MSNDSIIELHADEHEIFDDNEDMESVYEEVDESIPPSNQPEVKQQEVKQQEKKGKEEVKSNFYYDIDLSRKNIFYSDINMPEKHMKFVPEQVEYKFMTGSLEKMAQTIAKDIEDTSIPKNMIIQCFGKVLYNRTNQSVIEYIYDMIKEVDKQKVHKIAMATNHFIPAKPGTWQHCAHFNAEMRIANIDRGQPPLTLHKALMDREFVDHGPLLIKGSMWQEYVDGEGLGHTLSRAGYKKHLHFVLKAFENQFRDNHFPSKRYIGTPQPPPLAKTPGYVDNPRMMKILEEECLINCRFFGKVSQVPPENRFQAVDPPEQSSTPKPVPAPEPAVPQPGRASSSSSLNNTTKHSSEKERPKTWYGQNIVISEGSASRKVSLPGASNDSGVFDDSSRQRDERIFNEEQDKINKHVSWEELETAYDNLRYEHREDEKYYKKKIDELIMEKENLKDKLYDLKDENETLKLADDLHKSKLRSLQRQLEAKTEECEHKEERIKLVEQQCRFIKNLHNDMGELINDKQDKKKKRNN